MTLDPAEFRGAVARWYRAVRRDLPWRRTRDPYRIWISEIMLQQTRVAAAIPYYEAFLARFPEPALLAAAPEAEVLAAWAGLGYYSRARNLHAAAKQIAAAGGFPREYAAIRALPGIGDYTAAAVASIAFGEPYAVLDGNVMRVLARLLNDGGDVRSVKTRARLGQAAQALLDPHRPGDFNQALMELGATICLPKGPQCLLCPVAGHCEAKKRGTENRLPVKSRGAQTVRLELVLLLIRRAGKYLLWRRPPGAGRMAGFWELPEPAQAPGAVAGPLVGSFRHTITHHVYTVKVFTARLDGRPEGLEWVAASALAALPLSTLARKALALPTAQGRGREIGTAAH